MKTKMAKRSASRAATGNGQQRSVHAAVTSVNGSPSSLAGAVIAQTVKRAKARTPRRTSKPWDLRLYVMDQTAKSLMAFTNLKKLCEIHLKGQYRITVIDLLKQPQLAKGDQILAIPTVVRRLPKPVRMIIGNLTNTDTALVGLDLRPTH